MRANTLIELLVVIVIISILAALIASSLAQAKRKADETLCTIYKHQLKILYLQTFDDEVPSYTQKYFMESQAISTKCWQCHPSVP